MSGKRQIVVVGGGGFGPLLDFVLGLTRRKKPRVCRIGTATADRPEATLGFYSAMVAAGAVPSHLDLFPMPNVSDIGAHLLQQDAVWVGGGSVANLLAVWRVHGVDRSLREAWESGVVLSGVSAGGLCWFEAGTTDSFGVELRPFTNGLGFLAGSHCPHYDSEERRRPTYHRLVSQGVIPAGYAADDGVALHFVDRDLADVLADREVAKAWRVERAADGDGVIETAIAPRLVGENGEGPT